jgi:hypothetical protein
MNTVNLIAASLLAFSPLAWSSPDFDAQFEEIMPFCEQHFLPNSMAQLPGTDREARAKKINKQILKRSRLFGSNEGFEYLKARSGEEQDNVAKACISLILKNLGKSQ